MDNLITAIIAIGLLAAIAVMSANYGNDAITNWQAKMEATQIVGDAQNIAGAWREYARANNGSPIMSSYDWTTTSSALVSGYLPSLPKPPAGAVDATVNHYYPIKAKNYAFTTVGCHTTTSAPADTVAALLKSPKVCLAIAALAGYSTATVKATNLDGDLTAVSSRKPYDCIYVDSDASGGPTQGDTMLFIYRIFDQNNFSSTSPSCI